MATVDFSEGQPPVNPAAVRAFDIRGVVGRDLDCADARRLGGAFASLAQARRLRCIGVGRDGRLTSPALETALVEGLVDGGMEVGLIGCGPTPQLGFATRALRLDGCIMVTASHNPPEHNGFKLKLGKERLHGAALRELTMRPPAKIEGGFARSHSVQTAYIQELARLTGRMRAF